MKANELRLGNLIFSKETQEIETITTISDEYITFNSITFDYPVIEEIEPIPLTEEWLLRFGFCIERFDQYNLATKGKIKITYGDNFFYGGIFRIQYVHQLQNLYFALTGEELKPL